jgi:transglutaminase-like putative cysteine protease
LYVSETPRTVRHHVIPSGHWGIEATVGKMRGMARAALAHSEVVDAADGLTARAFGDRDAGDRIRAYLARNVRFVHDPPGVELIRTPRYMLRRIAEQGEAVGDCDDVAVLGAALGMAAGLRARYVLIGLTPDDPYEHVYTELVTRDGCVIELDTTRPAQMPPGVRIHRMGYREA